MTSTLLVLLLLSQAEGPDNPPDGAMAPPLSASSAGRWRYLARMEVTTLALLPRAGVGAEEGFAQMEPTLQGYFGPDYELARFRAAGPEDVPLAEAPFPDGFSVYGEAVMGWDAVRYGGPQRHLRLSLGTGGTLLFPEGVGALRPGACASVGLGVDNAR